MVQGLGVSLVRGERAVRVGGLMLGDKLRVLVIRVRGWFSIRVRVTVGGRGIVFRRVG